MILYVIANDRDSSVYVGATCELGRRWREHRHRLRRNKHENRLLQQAWNEFGEDAFKLKILAIYPFKYDLDFLESALIAKWSCYNIRPNSSYVAGYKRPEFSAEHRANLSAAGLRAWNDPEIRTKILDRDNYGRFK